jgi:hypothetical protein
MRIVSLILAGGIALAGCHTGDGGNGTGGNGVPDLASSGSGSDLATNGGGNDLAAGGGADLAGAVGADLAGAGGAADLAQPPDLADNGSPPNPTVKHVGATGVTAGLVADNQHAAYLLNASAANGGELHVVSASGTDQKIATGIQIGDYLLSPDSQWVVYLAGSGGTLGLHLFKIATGSSTNPLTTGLEDPQGQPKRPLAQKGFFSPSGHYFVTGARTNLANSADLDVIDLSTGLESYHRGNGAYDYLQQVLNNDTMLFQDTVGGTGGITDPPVQTFFFLPLKGATNSTPPTKINTKVANFYATPDQKTVVYQRTNGDLYAFDMASKSAPGIKIGSASGPVAIGPQPSGPVAYIAGDKSVHVVTIAGASLLSVAPSATSAGDPLSPITFSPSSSELYYFQNVDTQDTRGTLLHVHIAPGATPNKVGDNISTVDLHPTSGALVLLQNVDAKGVFADAAWGALDGSGVVKLGTGANVGNLAVVDSATGWSALHLTGATLRTDKPIDNGKTIVGGLAFASSSGDTALDAAVRAGEFAFSDDGGALAFIGGATFNATASNYVGALTFVATHASATKIAGKLSGSSELGPIVNRTLFVNAPTAAPAGVYFVTY